ncbi:hypothetical protein EDB85DRAFT_2024310 [Lactarius pseudohatsudake]|nr:hypothetical protein EDB85DRAFT_2024310 [Lactarius pseudohatsudake]
MHYSCSGPLWMSIGQQRVTIGASGAEKLPLPAEISTMLMELDVVPPQPSEHPGVALAESDLRMPPFLKGHAVEESRGRSSAISKKRGPPFSFPVNNGGGGGGGGMTEDAMHALNNMLWTAYLMMVENDGLNERQLREYARVDGWPRAFWFEEGGASCARLAIRDDAWPPNNDFRAVTMWLFWFLLRLGASHPPPLLDAHN